MASNKLMEVLIPTPTSKNHSSFVDAGDATGFTKNEVNDDGRVHATVGVMAGGSTKGAHALDALASASASRSFIPIPDTASKLTSQVQVHVEQHDQPSVKLPFPTSSDDDSEAMPPPPPREPRNDPTFNVETPTFTFLHDTHAFHSQPSYVRQRGGRLRSASNPEGMEKWDSYSRRNDRQHFVLPSSILEEELASTEWILEEREMNNNYRNGTDAEKQETSSAAPSLNPKFQQLSDTTESGLRRSKRAPKPKRLGTSPDSIMQLPDEEGKTNASSKNKKNARPRSNSKSKSTNGGTKPKPAGIKKSSSRVPKAGIVKIDSYEEEDVSQLEPEELLRRARTRLLEDLSESNNSSSTTMGHLPHSLSKYKEVYNKNGRIGIYTPAERAHIIHKFQAKRARRVWNKKIRYNCRKNLADRRVRVKGRFVKRSAGKNISLLNVKEKGKDVTSTTAVEDRNKMEVANTEPQAINESEVGKQDEEMPDVNDSETGFEPTDDMPYRRIRRYTIA